MDILVKSVTDPLATSDVSVQPKVRQTAAKVMEETKARSAESPSPIEEYASKRAEETVRVPNAQPEEEAKELEKAGNQIDKLFENYTNRKMQFSVDEETGKTIIKLYDRASGEVIRQIPSQEFLDMVSALNKVAQSLIKDIPKYI